MYLFWEKVELGKYKLKTMSLKMSMLKHGIFRGVIFCVLIQFSLQQNRLEMCRNILLINIDILYIEHFLQQERAL